MNRARAGDSTVGMASTLFDRPSAFYRQHHAFVGRCLARFGIADDAIEDARQEVFVTAFRRVHTFEGRSSMRAWLAGIARRVAFRARRSDARHRRRVAVVACASVEQVQLDDWIREREALAVLDAFVEALDPGKRDAFLLCELEGLSARAAAEELGANPATVYSRVRVARSLFETMCADLNTRGSGVTPDRAARAHRESQGADPEQVQRSWTLLAAQLPGLASAAPSGTLLATLSAQLVAAAVGLSVIGTGAWVIAMRPAEAEAPAPSSGDPVSVRTRDALPRPAAPPVASTLAMAEAPGKQPAPRRAAEPPGERRRTSTDALAAEIELLETADRRYASGRWALAQRSAERYLREHPVGRLRLDALAIAVKAACRQGSHADVMQLSETHLPAGDARRFALGRCPQARDFMNPEPGGD